MMRLYYSGGSVVTGVEIAEAVLAYAQALARTGKADVVHIPIVQEEDLKQSTAALLIGPASQLLAVPVVSEGVTGPIDTELVGELERRTLRLGSPRPVPQGARETGLAEGYE